MITSVIFHLQIYVFNYGKMKRDFTYIDDIIMGTRSAIEKNYLCEIFNLGNHKSEKLMDMIGIIEKNVVMLSAMTCPGCRGIDTRHLLRRVPSMTSVSRPIHGIHDTGIALSIDDQVNCRKT